MKKKVTNTHNKTRAEFEYKGDAHIAPLGYTEEDEVVTFDLINDKNILICAPTGFGGGVMFGNLIEYFSRGRLINPDDNGLMKIKLFGIDFQDVEMSIYSPIFVDILTKINYLNKFLEEIRFLANKSTELDSLDMYIVIFINNIDQIPYNQYTEFWDDLFNLIDDLEGNVSIVARTATVYGENYCENVIPPRLFCHSLHTVLDPNDYDAREVLLGGFYPEIDVPEGTKGTALIRKMDDEGKDEIVKYQIFYPNMEFEKMLVRE